MIATNIEYYDELAEWQHESVSDVLHTLVHDVNNINHTIKGFAHLLDMSMNGSPSPDPELTERAIEAIMNRTDELDRLMRLTAAYAQAIENDF